MIVRVDYAGGSREVFVSTATMETVIILPDPRPPATISLLDPATCEVLASGGLPAEQAIVTLADGATPGSFDLSVNLKTVGSGAVAPADARCAGR